MTVINYLLVLFVMKIIFVLQLPKDVEHRVTVTKIVQLIVVLTVIGLEFAYLVAVSFSVFYIILN